MKGFRKLLFRGKTPLGKYHYQAVRRLPTPRNAVQCAGVAEHVISQPSDSKSVISVSAAPDRRTVPPGQLDNRSGASTDAELIALWLESKASLGTRRAYTTEVLAFLAFLGPGRGLRTVTVADVQGWVRSRSGKAAATMARSTSAIKSLLTFGQRTGYLVWNVGSVVQPPHVPNELAERILDEREVTAVVESATSYRDSLMLRLFYATGARRAELAALRWSQLHASPQGAVITLHGKGGKTRHVLIAAELAFELFNYRAGAPDDAFVFVTRTGHAIHPDNLTKVFKAIALRSNVNPRASLHSLRHSHASHALDHGAPVGLVQASLGHASLATTGRYVHARPTDGASLYLRVPKGNQGANYSKNIPVAELGTVPANDVRPK